MQHAEVLRNFLVFAHGVGDTRAGVHAGQRGADEGEEDRDGFGQHEVSAMALTQQLVADNDHHVAQRRR